MNEKKFTKLKDLVGSDFTIEKVNGYKFKMWDVASNKMVMEDNWFKGGKKVYQTETDKGLLDLSESQLGTIFAQSQHNGESNIIGTVVGVKSNGEQGINIRYYLNVLRQVQEQEMSYDESGAPTDY